jgi:predicted permease
MQEEIRLRLSVIPGVTAAAFANGLPLAGRGGGDVIQIEDRPYVAGQTLRIHPMRWVSPGWFQTLGTRIIIGRDFTSSDVLQINRVVIISENMARSLWGDPARAIGKRIRLGGAGAWQEIVGVVGDIRYEGLNQPAAPVIYWPALMDRYLAQSPYVPRSMFFAVRSERAATEDFLRQVREAVWSVNPNLPVAQVQTLQDVYGQSLARTSFALVLLATAGAMAFLLGTIGIHGVIAYTVSQRRREIGIRLALGAPQGKVQRMFVQSGLALAGIGVAIGVAAALGLTRLMKSLLFEISPLDPFTYIAMPVFLVTAAAVASYLPARRTAAVDPVECLRSQ